MTSKISSGLRAATPGTSTSSAWRGDVVVGAGGCCPLVPMAKKLILLHPNMISTRQKTQYLHDTTSGTQLGCRQKCIHHELYLFL